MFNRRLSNEPISKIINKKYFWKDEFFVNKFVLDPRPETETIIEESLNTNKNEITRIEIKIMKTNNICLIIFLDV